MSTKIYDGCRFKNNPKNLYEVKDILNKFKEKALKYYQEKYNKLFASIFYSIFDEAVLYKKVSHRFLGFKNRKEEDRYFNKYELHSIFDEIRIYENSYLRQLITEDIDNKSKVFRNQLDRFHPYSEYDFYCSVMLFPSKNNLLALVITEDEEVKEMFVEMEEIEEYPYWDNTDRPDNMTDKEWEKRRDEWDKTIGYKRLSEVGFQYNIIEDLFLLRNKVEWESIQKYIRSPEERAKSRAGNILFAEWSKDKIDYIADHLISSLEEYENYKKENIEKLNDKTNEILLKLKKDFTEEDWHIEINNFAEKYELEEQL